MDRNEFERAAQMVNMGPIVNLGQMAGRIATTREKAMPKFRKKPVVIEATQWFKNGDHPEDGNERYDFEGMSRRSEGKVVRYYRHPDVPGNRPCEQCGQPHHIHGWIDTLEQGHRVCPGDWIITGVQGERYPCKPDIFAATYEPAEVGQGAMCFGRAVQRLKLGERVARAGWNGKGMFVYLVPANAYPAQTGAAMAYFGEGALVPYNAYLAIKNVNDTVSTWVPSVNDVLAEDWAIVE